MNWPAVRRYSILSFSVVVLGLILLSEFFVSSDQLGWLQTVYLELSTFFVDPQTQWLTVLCLACYFIALMVLEIRLAASKGGKRLLILSICLVICVACVLSRYAIAYASGSTGAVIPAFLAGIVFAKAISAGLMGKYFSENKRTLILLIACLLAGISRLHMRNGRAFDYDNITRWCGPWDNPNVYGMMMGVGMILGFGLGIWEMGGFRFSVFGFRVWAILRVLLSFIAVIVCGIGLFKSYSRGAWVATICGLAYIVVQRFRVWDFGSHMEVRGRRESSKFQVPSSGEGPISKDPGSAECVTRAVCWLLQNWRALAVIMVSVAVIAFWQFRFTAWRPASRVFSIAKINDFSWRKRVTASEGAIRMMVDKPWFGYGWGQAEEVYQRKYCPPQLENGLAIQMNDYFMLGISAGAPALACFLVYVALSLREPKSEIRNPKVAGQSRGWIAGLVDKWIFAKACCVFPPWRRETGAPGEIASIDTKHSSLNAPLERTLDFEPGSLDWSKTLCRAGGIALLVGFWFDGGLFKPATGSVFWILLELGRADTNGHEADLPRANRGVSTTFAEVTARPERLEKSQERVSNEMRTEQSEWHLVRAGGTRVPLWKWVAGVVGALALIETIVLVGVPFLPVNQATLAIARHWLVPPKAVEDLDFLAAEMTAQPALARGDESQPGKSRGRDARVTKLQLGILLQHASLANYNRQIINWPVDDEVYRDYVLWPKLFSESPKKIQSPTSSAAPPVPGNLNWRRALWEYFYPPVRHEVDPLAAAGIVVKFLRQRVSVVPHGPLTIEEIWRQRKADVNGFEALKVAAFRSVGIPARLNENGHAELFANGKWQAMPKHSLSEP